MKQKDECRLWLESYRELKAEEQRLWHKHEKLMAQATRITTQLRDMPGGGDSDPERLLAALADEAEEALSKHNEAVDRRREIEDFISNLEIPIHRIILRLRYIECHSWVKISFALQRAGYWYDERTIYKFHGAALKAARKLWKERRTEEDGGLCGTDSQHG